MDTPYIKFDGGFIMVPWNQFDEVVEWYREKMVRHQVKRQMNPFARVIEERAELLRRKGLLHAQEAFVKQEHIVGNEMIGKVGFRLRSKVSLPDKLLNEVEIETIEPTLFVVMDSFSNDPYACFSLMLLLQSFGFEPAGPNGTLSITR